MLKKCGVVVRVVVLLLFIFDSFVICTQNETANQRFGSEDDANAHFDVWSNLLEDWTIK